MDSCWSGCRDRGLAVLEPTPASCMHSLPPPGSSSPDILLVRFEAFLSLLNIEDERCCVRNVIRRVSFSLLPNAIAMFKVFLSVAD